jgi:hypothetical protein
MIDEMTNDELEALISENIFEFEEALLIEGLELDDNYFQLNLNYDEGMEKAIDEYLLDEMNEEMLEEYFL